MIFTCLASSICGHAPVPTWADVRPILEANCVACHRDGGAAPFPLTEAPDVARRAGFIKEVTGRRLMPPWPYTHAGLEVSGARGLSDAEIALLAAWSDGGHPIGEDAAAATLPSSVSTDIDMVIAMPQAWTMPAEGQENWGRRDRDKWTFVVPIDNESPLRVEAMTHTSTSPQAIHAVTYLADDSGTAAWNDARDEQLGTYMTGDVRDHPSGMLGGTGIGARTLVLPDGYHFDVPAGSDLVMEVHFRPSGRPHQVQEQLGLGLSDDPDSRPVRTLVSMVRSVDVPVGGTAVVEDEFALPESVDLVAMMPRAMGVCTDIHVTGDIPGEGEVTLLESTDWDPHWRAPLVLKDPKFLPAGTVLRTRWRIENTEENPRNPFVPLKRLTMARRTGAVAMFLYAAAESVDADRRLLDWHKGLMRSRR